MRAGSTKRLCPYPDDFCLIDCAFFTAAAPIEDPAGGRGGPTWIRKRASRSHQTLQHSQRKIDMARHPAQIAALYVDTDGPYSTVENVDMWPQERDARGYAGPYPVIAHPPCERWGRFWRGSIRKGAPRHKLGDDDGCFEAALNSVRAYGGVLEHPALSYAWATFGIKRPETVGGWLLADTHGGFTCQVWQGRYGHRTAKATWLYAVGSPLPGLRWGRIDKEYSISNLLHFKPSLPLFSDVPHVQPKKQVTKRERRRTPLEFRDLLIELARNVNLEHLPQSLFDFGNDILNTRRPS